MYLQVDNTFIIKQLIVLICKQEIASLSCNQLEIDFS